MRNSRRFYALISLIVLVLTSLACEDGPPPPSYPIENRGITCITVVDGVYIAPIKVGGFTEDSQNYDLLKIEERPFYWNWEIEYHREAESPTGHPYGLLNYLSPIHPPGPLPECEATSTAIDPSTSFHHVRFVKGLRIEESWDGGRSWHILRDLPELRQEIRYYFFDENDSYCWPCDIPTLSIGPHDVDFDPETGHIVFAMGWDGILVYTPEREYKWHWVQVQRYSLGYIGEFDRAYEVLMFEYWLAGAFGFLILTSLVTYLFKRTLYRIVMLCIGWIGWFTLLLAYTPLDVQGIMPGVDKGIEAGILALFLLLVVALPMIILSLIDLVRYLMSRSVYLVLLSLFGTAAYLIPYYLWLHAEIPRYNTAKLIAFIISVVLVGGISRIITISGQGWTQKVTLPPRTNQIDSVPLGSVLERTD